ncbi:MAG: PEGA domain-containing protein [bacterium]
MRNIKILLIILTGLTAIITSAQTGSIKIFSEVKGISVYLDEEFRGTDIKEIANVQKGSHYLKIKKDTVTIYEQIALVEENSVTTVVLKDTPDMQKKLLAIYSTEIAKYDSVKLSVSTNLSFYKGPTGITISEFAKITGNFDLEKKIRQRYNSASLLGNSGGVLMVLSLIGTGLTFSSILLNWPDFPTDVDALLPYIGTASIVGCLAGYVMANIGSSNMQSSEEGLITYEAALAEVERYNADLRKKFGVPENYR